MLAGTPPGAPAGVGWSASSLRAQRRTLARRERRVQSRAGQARVASSAGAPESRLRGRLRTSATALPERAAVRGWAGMRGASRHHERVRWRVSAPVSEFPLKAVLFWRSSRDADMKVMSR